MASAPAAMGTAWPPIQGRGMDPSLPTCGDEQCSGHGQCVGLPGGGDVIVCDCDLGYKGDSCEDTFNGSLSLPLTISVVVVIVGLLILAFIVAKLRRRQKRKKRQHLAAKDGYNISV